MPHVMTGHNSGEFGTTGSPYDNNQMCLWKIQVPRNQVSVCGAHIRGVNK